MWSPGRVWGGAWGWQEGLGAPRGYGPLSIVTLLVTDIPEIPESIKFCKALEIADFSGNPLSRWVVAMVEVVVGCGRS